MNRRNNGGNRYHLFQDKIFERGHFKYIYIITIDTATRGSISRVRIGDREGALSNIDATIITTITIDTNYATTTITTIIITITIAITTINVITSATSVINAILLTQTIRLRIIIP